MTDKLMTGRETGTTGPALDLPGTWNARDVGGRAVPQGAQGPLATGVLLRTASLAALDPAGVAALDAHDVRTVLDLRSPQEVARDGADVVHASTQVLSLPFGTPHPEKGPALADDDGTPAPQMPAEATGEVTSEVAGADMTRVLTTLVGTETAATADPAELGHAIMTGIYRRFVTDPVAHAAVGTALTAIASSTHTVLVHCTAGKDRTGWIVALVQSICSVPADQILQEYLLSARATTELAAAMPAVPGVDAAVWQAVLAVRPEYLMAAQQEAERGYGSLTGYLDAIGVDADLRALLRARFGLAPV